MNCEQFKENILGYLYEEVSGVEAAAMAKHLAACPRCNDEINELKLVRNELAEWKDPAQRDFPVSIPYPSPWAVIRQWIFPDRWSWRNALAWATAASFLMLVTLSVLGTRIEVSKSGFAFHADLLRGSAPAPVASPVSTTMAAEDKARLMQEVSRMIQESENRQQDLLKSEETRMVNQLTSGYRAQLTHLANSLDTKHKMDWVSMYDNLEQQRLADLQRIRMTFSSLDERTNQQAQQTQQLVDFIRNASYQKK